MTHPLDFRRSVVAPSGRARSIVDFFWSVEWNAGARPRGLHAPPDGRLHLVYRRRGGLPATLEVRGPRSRAERAPLDPGTETVGMCLRAGCGDAFGVPARDWTGRSVPWTETGIRDDLLGVLERQATPRERIAALDRFASGLMHGADRRIDAAVATIARSRGELATGAIAKSLDLSERQLRRLFSERVGLSPKSYSRVTRFHSLLADCFGQELEGWDPAKPPRRSWGWAELALRHDYADQAHMVREFREMTTMSPTEYFGRLAGACPFSTRDSD